jgi:hypothetical protein
VVETDYRGSVAYFSGHRTSWTAFTATTPYGPFAAPNGSCQVRVVKAALEADHASFLTVGDFNIPGLIDSPCLLRMATTPWTARAIGADRLLSSTVDHGSVFEVVGPGTAQPDLVDRTAGVAPVGRADLVKLAANGQGDAGGTGYEASAVHGEVEFDWTWGAPEPLSQVTVGSVVGVAAGPRQVARPVAQSSVAIELPGGVWQTVATAAGPVGDGDSTPYLLATLPPGEVALGLRVSARTTAAAEVSYVNALGVRRERT